MGGTGRGGATVVFSGGQDSTTCLYWALEEGFDPINIVTFGYGQRHYAELTAAEIIREGFEELASDRNVVTSHETVFLPEGTLGGTSPLTDLDAEVEKYDDAESLPGGIEKTFVPLRNLLFLTLGANRAIVRGDQTIVIGVSEEDFGGYPDCRAKFLDAVAETIGIAVEGAAFDVAIEAPLLKLSKAATVRLSEALPGARHALEFSHTCYEGTYPPCGSCHSCLLRSKGFAEAGVSDPLIVRALEEAAYPGDKPDEFGRFNSGDAS